MFTRSGNARRIQGENMRPGTLRPARRPEPQAYHKTERSSEAQPTENEAIAIAIAAQLRAQIPCSTDPAWLERMAREVESK
jgi:hypothetical protein